jgi:uncharacterized protein YjbI with pentapeptide repeats
MNHEKTIALFKLGQEEWNKWAEGMLAKKRALEEKGLWLGGNKEKSEWIEEAKADFTNFQFPYYVFAGFIFPGDATFSGATFTGNTTFSGATFTGDANFPSATFTGGATFYGATFIGHANFSGATFTDNATFSGATFTGGATFYGATFKKHAFFAEAKFNNVADFRLCTFEGLYTNFRNACFHQANFMGINVVRGFDLCGAIFVLLPDFIQAHFSEAPRLDDVLIDQDASPDNKTKMRTSQRKLGPSLFLFLNNKLGPIFRWGIRFFHAEKIRDDDTVIPNKEPGDKTPCAKWRALRRLAVQGHDHENELTFLAGEIRARRGMEDKPWSAAWLFGWLYELLSDFGGSIGKPFCGCWDQPLALRSSILR